MFRVYATIDPRTSPGEARAKARRAEALGYDGLNVADGVHDGLLVAAMALDATTRLQVAITVLVAFPRSPMTVAHAAWDLQAMSRGRFALGLGAQVRANVVGRYATPWTSPVPRMREYLHSLRAIFTCFQQGGPLRFEGKSYRFDRLQPFFNPGPIETPEIPLLLGAVGPEMTALAGEAADALVTHPTSTHPRYLREVTWPGLRKGAARTNRDTNQVKLVLSPLVATGANAEQALAARERQRRLLSFLYATPAYWSSLELLGWGERGPKLRQLTREGRWEEMPGVISEEMLDEVLPTAPFAEIADVLLERYADLATMITFPLPEDPALDPEVAQVVTRLRD
jgi:probable F420-dependent oxidoreductase